MRTEPDWFDPNAKTSEPCVLSTAAISCRCVQNMRFCLLSQMSKSSILALTVLRSSTGRKSLKTVQVHPFVLLCSPPVHRLALKTGQDAVGKKKDRPSGLTFSLFNTIWKLFTRIGRRYVFVFKYVCTPGQRCSKSDLTEAPRLFLLLFIALLILRNYPKKFQIFFIMRLDVVKRHLSVANKGFSQNAK